MPNDTLQFAFGNSASASQSARPTSACRFACLLRRLIVLGALALTSVGMSPTLAASPESVVMPFACSIDGRRLRLDPAPQRTYRVIGPREQQLLRTCSPDAMWASERATKSSGSRNCRSLELYRFTFDCGGYRVQWMDAALASAHHRGYRASMSAGRITLHRWPHWPERDGLLPVTLPVGFAPGPASGLRFVSSEPREKVELAQLPPRETVPAVAPASIDDVVAGLPRLPPMPDSEDATVTLPAFLPILAISNQEDAPAEESNPPPLPRMGQGWTATVTSSEDLSGRFRWDALVPGSGSHALLAGIGVAALLLSATAVATRQGGASRFPGLGRTGAPGPQPQAAGAHASRRPPPLKTSEPPPPPPTRPPLPRGLPLTQADPVSELASALATSPAPSPDDGGWSAVIEMRTTADALMALVHQIIADHVPDGALRDVLASDLNAIASRLDGAEMTSALELGRLDLVHLVYAQAIVDLERVRTLARIEYQRSLEAVGSPSRTPATVEEACAFLGVNPRAREAIVKKVVDALRQNWHPDQALDESDRRLREERIKSINAAWDLIRSR